MRKNIVGLSIATSIVVLSACDSSGGSGPGAGTGAAGSSRGTGGSAGASGSSGSGGGLGGRRGTGGGAADAGIGPVAMVRIVNLVKDKTFDVWVADLNYMPKRILQNLAYEDISEYLDVPLGQISQTPTFVLLPSDTMPSMDPAWQTDAALGNDRARVEVTDLNAADQRATILMSLADDGMRLEYETLNETKLKPGDPTKANLHIAYHIFDLGGGVVPTFAVVGQPCLTTESVAVSDVESVAPGDFELGVYDRQNVSDCTELLASVKISAKAGDNVLVPVYHEGAQVKFLVAPIAAP